MVMLAELLVDFPSVENDVAVLAILATTNIGSLATRRLLTTTVLFSPLTIDPRILKKLIADYK